MSEAEQTVHLYDEGLVAQAGVAHDGGVPLVRIDDEQLSAGLYSQRNRTLLLKVGSAELNCTSALTKRSGVKA